MNVGYDLIFTLSLAILQALRKPELHLLVIGAGGGKEVRTFLPAHPGWRLTGIDPSARMLAKAQHDIETLDLKNRAKLMQGYIHDLGTEEVFDAATCIYVLQFIPDNGEKLELLRALAERLAPDSPLVLVDGALKAADEADLFEAWQEYGTLVGMPSAQMTAILSQLRTSTTVVSVERQEALLHEAGFENITQFYTGLMIHGWIAHRTRTLDV